MMKKIPFFFDRRVILAARLVLTGLVASRGASAQSSNVYDWNWATQLGPSSGNNRTAFVRGIAADAAGNVTIGGDFDPDLSFAKESALLQTNRQPEASTGFTFTNGFLAQYRPDGRLAWTMNLNGTDAQVSDVATDAAGNVYALGSYFRGTITFGTGPMLTGGPVFLAKLSPAGVVQWAVNVSDTRRGATTWRLAVDAAGNSVVQGEFENSITVGSQTYTGTGSAYHPFLARYTPGGALSGSWAGQQTGKNDERFYTGLALAPTGEVYLTGSVSGATLQFGTLPPVATTAGNGANGFLLKISASNTAEWVLVGRNVANSITDVKTSPGGSIYALLSADPGSLTLGNQPLPNPNNDNSYVVRLTSRGTLLRSMAGTSGATRLALSPHDDLYVGSMHGAVNWGNVQLPALAAGQQKVSVVRLDSTGQGLQGWQASGPSIFRGMKLAVDGLGQAAITGWLYSTGTFNFGTHPVTSSALSGMLVGRTGAQVLAARTSVPVAGLELYPNPARQTVTVGLASAAPAQVQLLDVLGRVVATQALPHNGQLNLGGLAPGPYLLRVQQGIAVSYRHLTVLP